MGVPGWEGFVPLSASLPSHPPLPLGRREQSGPAGSRERGDVLDLGVWRGMGDTTPSEGPSPALRTPSQTPPPPSWTN